MYYANKLGIFKLNESKSIFEKDAFLSKTFENDEYKSGKLIVDKSNKLWVFTKNYINYFTLGKFSESLKSWLQLQSKNDVSAPLIKSINPTMQSCFS
jgi:hypothetical protein